MAGSKSKVKKIDIAFIELALPRNVKETIMQPNKITNASMSYNRRQMDALILILERMQSAMEEQIFKGVTVEQLNLFQDPNTKLINFEIPIKDFGVSPKKYQDLKQDLLNMATIPVRFQQIDPKTGTSMEFAGGFYTARVPSAWGRAVQIEIHRDIAKHLIDISGGFTQYNRRLALSFKSVYAKRLYIFISSWKHKGGTIIKMSEFRKIMDVVDKYPNYKDLYRWVIKPCHELLKKTADCWFEVAPKYEEGENQPSQLIFKIISQPLNAFEENKLQQQKRLIEGGLFKLGLKAGHREDILSRVHPGNVLRVVQKVCELENIMYNDTQIKDPDAYYFKAISNFLSEN